MEDGELSGGLKKVVSEPERGKRQPYLGSCGSFLSGSVRFQFGSPSTFPTPAGSTTHETLLNQLIRLRVGSRVRFTSG